MLTHYKKLGLKANERIHNFPERMKEICATERHYLNMKEEGGKNIYRADLKTNTYILYF
jgi:hypothetical protein